MSPGQKSAISRFIYKFKDYGVMTALFGFLLWATRFAGLPERVTKLEDTQAQTNIALAEVRTGVKYLVREQKKGD